MTDVASTEDMRVARLFLFADWPQKKYFSGQSEGGISNASGTRSVRVSAQGLSRSCCKLWPMKIPLSRLAAPGSPRMHLGWPLGYTLTGVLPWEVSGFWAKLRSALLWSSRPLNTRKYETISAWTRGRREKASSTQSKYS